MNETETRSKGLGVYDTLGLVKNRLDVQYGSIMMTFCLGSPQLGRSRSEGRSNQTVDASDVSGMLFCTSMKTSKEKFCLDVHFDSGLRLVDGRRRMLRYVVERSCADWWTMDDDTVLMRRWCQDSAVRNSSHANLKRELSASINHPPRHLNTTTEYETTYYNSVERKKEKNAYIFQRYLTRMCLSSDTKCQLFIRT